MAASLAIVVAGSLAGGTAFAGQGDSVHVYSTTSPNSPLASFVDAETGRTYNFALIANEGADSGGNTTFHLQGGAISACTTHGGSVGLTPDPNNPGVFNGSNPLTQIQCGTAFGQRVRIRGCAAEMEAHGFVHSDHPQPAIYAGTTTMDVRYRKSRNSDDIEVTIYTPKDKITLSGKVSGQTVTMSTCQ